MARDDMLAITTALLLAAGQVPHIAPWGTIAPELPGHCVFDAMDFGARSQIAVYTSADKPLTGTKAETAAQRELDTCASDRKWTPDQARDAWQQAVQLAMVDYDMVELLDLEFEPAKVLRTYDALPAPMRAAAARDPRDHGPMDVIRTEMARRLGLGPEDVDTTAAVHDFVTDRVILDWMATARLP